MRIWIIGILLSCVPCAGQRLGDSAAFSIRDGHRAREALLADVDGDGLEDLVINVVSDAGVRKLQVHRRRASGARFVGTPDQTFEVANASGFAVADVHADAGREIVLLSARGAFALRPNAADEERFVRLFPCDLLWQVPDKERIRALPDLVQDLDGNGTDDLMVPEPDGYRVALQRRGVDGAQFDVVRLDVPRESFDMLAGAGRQALKLQGRTGRTSIRVQVQPGDDSMKELARKGPLLRMVEDCPAPQVLDWNGDGKRDLICQGIGKLHVFLQGAGFPERPSVSHDLPVVANRERRLDVSYSAHLHDVDQDGRADAIFFNGDQRSSEIRTQVQLFVQGRGQKASSPLFGKGLPQQYLVLRGFAGIPQVVDVDGDGRRDLVAGSVRPDLLDRIRSGKGKIEAELFVFRNLGAKFSEKPDLVHGVSLPADDLRDARSGDTALFFADVTGEGTRELLLHNERDRISLLYVRKTGRGKLEIFAKPVWEMAVDRKAVVYPHAPEGGRPEILILERRQAIHVRF